MNILFNSRRFISDASSYSDSSNHGFIPAKQIFHSIFSYPLIDLMATVPENISVEFTKLTKIASVLCCESRSESVKTVSGLFALLITQTAQAGKFPWLQSDRIA